MSYTGSRFTTPLYTGDGTGATEKDQARVFHLMELHLDTTLYLTDNFYNIAYDSATAPDSGSNTYNAAGQLLGFGAVSETTQIKVNNISINLSGVDTGDISDVVHGNIINKRIVIYRTFLDDNNAFQTNRTYLLFDGNIKNFSAVEKGDESTITFNVASHWANFEATNGRFTNNASQHTTKRYGTTEIFNFDQGFEWSSTQTQDIKWGSV